MSVITSSWLGRTNDDDLLAAEKARRAGRVARRAAKAQQQADADDLARRQRLSRGLANALRQLQARRHHEALVHGRQELAVSIFASGGHSSSGDAGAMTDHLRAVLKSSPADACIALLRDLVDAGLLHCADSEDANRLFALFDLEIDPTTAAPSGPHWSWWEALHRSSTGTLTRRATSLLADSGDPALLDELLEAGQSTAVADATQIVDDDTRRYLRARTHLRR